VEAQTRVVTVVDPVGGSVIIGSTGADLQIGLERGATVGADRGEKLSIIIEYPVGIARSGTGVVAAIVPRDRDIPSGLV
jgi:hypothetical protein